jgi:hypothetical protein
MSKAESAAQAGSQALAEPTRVVGRFVPVEPVSAVLLVNESFLGYGVVSNISERGACLITNIMIEPQHKIRVKFTDGQRREFFQAQAQVVWSGEGMDPNSEIVGVTVGITFHDLSDAQRKRIAEVLNNGSFHPVGELDSPEEREVLLPASQPVRR